MKVTSLRKKLYNDEFVYKFNIVENISNFYAIKDISPFAEDYGAGTLPSRFRSPRVKSAARSRKQAVATTTDGVNDLGRKFRARSCERNTNQPINDCDCTDTRVPVCTLRIMSSFSLSLPAYIPSRSLFFSLLLSVPFYSVRSARRSISPFDLPSSSIRAQIITQTAACSGVLVEITNSLATE